MAPGLGVEELQKELEAAKLEFNRWANERIDAVENVHSQHMALGRDADSKAQELRRREEMHNIAAAELQKVLEKQRVEVEKMQGELAEVKAEERTLPVVVAQLAEEAEREKAAIDEEIAELEDAGKIKRAKADALLLAAEMYRTNLGLRFERSEGDNLRLVFTHLDLRDHSREFSFVLHTTKTYHVVECVPRISGVDELVRTVNATNDFGTFVRAMRNKFKGTL